MVSPDLTSHIPSPGGLELKAERAEAGAEAWRELMGLVGGGKEQLELKFKSFSLPIFAPTFSTLQTYQVGPRVWHRCTDLITNSKQRGAQQRQFLTCRAAQGLMGSLQSLQSDFLVLGGGWLGQRLWHLGYRAGCAERLESDLGGNPESLVLCPAP